MKIARTVAEVRGALAGARRRGEEIGLVPTMGAFHEGHLSLMRRARAECGLVVVSLFVNPAQFNDPADLDNYPRDERRDAEFAQQAGVDVLFIPAAAEMYPEGFATSVSVAGVSQPLEGQRRGPEHFAGVATIVVKLLNIVAPDRAYFGQKDGQQAALIKRLVRDLDIPIRLEICPTVRAPDGLACSSRNVRLSATDRVRAAALYRALQAAERAIAEGVSDRAAVLAVARRELDLARIEPEYLELVDPETFTTVEQPSGEVLAVVAASLNGTRLIDNHVIQVPGAHAPGATPTIVAAGKRASKLLARPAA